MSKKVFYSRAYNYILKSHTTAYTRKGLNFIFSTSDYTKYNIKHNYINNSNAYIYTKNRVLNTLALIINSL